MGLFGNSVDARGQWHLSKLVSLLGLDAVRQRLRGRLLDISKMAFQVFHVLDGWIICNQVVSKSAECMLNASKSHATFPVNSTSGLHYSQGHEFWFVFFSDGLRRELLMLGSIAVRMSFSDFAGL
jgi:hypothetical protein